MTKNNHKNKTINNKDGFVVHVETFNRERLDTVIISVLVSYYFVSNADWTIVKRHLSRTLSNWLEQQSDYDKNKKLFVFDYPGEANAYYTAKYRTFDYQIYLKRISPPLKTWKLTVESVMPLLEVMKTATKEICSEIGVQVTHRPSANPKIGEAY